MASLRHVAIVAGFVPVLFNGQPIVRIHVGPNHRASGPDTLNRNESWITASATNPRVLVTVSQIIRPTGRGCATMVSSDGGNTWRDVTLPRQDDCFDPMVVAAPDGRLHILHTALAAPAAGQGAAGFGLRSDAPVRVFTSTDDGKTWRGPAEMRTPVRPDHPRLGIDQSEGPHRGRVYVATPAAFRRVAVFAADTSAFTIDSRGLPARPVGAREDVPIMPHTVGARRGERTIDTSGRRCRRRREARCPRTEDGAGSTLRPNATWTPRFLNRSARGAGQPVGAILTGCSDPRRSRVSRQWITSSRLGGPAGQRVRKFSGRRQVSGTPGPAGPRAGAPVAHSPCY